MKLVLTRKQVALVNFAVFRMIQAGNAMVGDAMLKGSTITAEQAKQLSEDVKELESIRGYLSVELQKEESPH